MLRPLIPPLLLLWTAACSGSGTTAPSAPPVEYPVSSATHALEAIRRHWNLPGMGLVVIRDGRIDVQSVVGVRRAGDTTQVQLRDRWHIGSITKSMTASVAARLVDRGLVRWETTVAEALPDLMASADQRWRGVTLAQLLQMRAGVDDAVMDQRWSTIWANRSQEPGAQRRAVTTLVLASSPRSTSGTAWAYANASYVLAGHMLERMAGQSWETLIRNELFVPLGVSSGGFGAPASVGAPVPDQPWGHTARGKAMTAVPPGPEADNPAALGPAGTVHVGLEDLGRYAAAHLASARGATAWLTQASGARIRLADAPITLPGFPSGSRYAMGWLQYTDARAGGRPVLVHDGSNQSFYAYLWLVPEKNAAIVVTTNAGGASAGAALDSAVTLFATRLEAVR